MRIHRPHRRLCLPRRHMDPRVGRTHTRHDGGSDRPSLLRRPSRRPAVRRRTVAREPGHDGADARMARLGDGRHGADRARGRSRAGPPDPDRSAGPRCPHRRRAARARRQPAANVSADVRPAHQPERGGIDRAGHARRDLHSDRSTGRCHAPHGRPGWRRLGRSLLCDVGSRPQGGAVARGRRDVRWRAGRSEYSVAGIG